MTVGFNMAQSIMNSNTPSHQNRRAMWAAFSMTRLANAFSPRSVRVSLSRLPTRSRGSSPLTIRGLSLLVILVSRGLSSRRPAS